MIVGVSILIMFALGGYFCCRVRIAHSEVYSGVAMVTGSTTTYSKVETTGDDDDDDDDAVELIKIHQSRKRLSQGGMQNGVTINDTQLDADDFNSSRV